MVLRFTLFSVLILGLVGFLGVAWIGLRPEPTPQEIVAAPVRASFLAAARPVRAGSLLRPDDITSVEMDVATTPPEARRDTPQARADLVGQMALRPVGQGSPFMTEDFLRPGDRGFLAALLAPGMRAASIGVDAISGISGLIWPGDRVDVVLTQTIGDETVPLERRIAGQTVLIDSRVIAIDQAIVQGAVGDGPEANRQVRTVTLEVAPHAAERLAVAARLGRLSLTVRASSNRDGDAAQETDAVTWGGDVSPALRAAPGTVTNPRPIQVHLGGNRREEFRF
ncbi:Flp pilus assembly protein CpaB [Roseomonas stagni]|uniref:Flp pilus assembly protein CpaB n=1 Tax=Falsiroseomonas algicola TaxID=2716930 RepID=A0A6M1LNY5_9PROT|nr:Flp pilus assembly protein CpaB [Falsiroseomonas algicola]NGM22076.1 Flp pilus assembly protein CpaB [Falsiroseomonas algicola]